MSLEKLSEKDKPMEQIKSSILPRFSLKDIGRKLDKLDSDKPNVVQNKLDGCRREEQVGRELKKMYPERKGYTVLRERELCDRDGNPVKDSETGQKRRIDFVVVKDEKVVDMVEVTSETAPKRNQLQKEYRIRSVGGNYVQYEGRIYRIPDNVETRVRRL